MMIGKWLGSVRTTGKCEGMYYGVRTMVGKASNRSGVHGSRPPDAKSLDNSRRVNNNHPTQPPRRFHELIQDIKPTIKYKPRAPPPIPVVTFNSHNFKNVPSALFASPS
ncbi:hypothetical protein F2Q68_00017759 [Brassica cretica]|uniref:Uncharacterized protein n=1 Tax=Brassica cretica TaxID=69181 RepID=A0A8S9HVL8_BRACR|nr:hypothetical protein F2Q68_00017759 [Brassica cretica]